MTIKELLRAHRLASVDARNADTVKERETEFDLISAIAKKVRKLRKQRDPADALQPVVKDDTGPLERS